MPTMEEQLPTEPILTDLRAVLTGNDEPIELEDGVFYSPSKDVVLTVVARSWHTYDPSMKMHDHFRALVAIGGLVSADMGLVEAKHCFASMWYGIDRALRTVDFYRQMP